MAFFFRNRTVNLLNLHYGIHTIALSGGGAFFAVSLLKSGVFDTGRISVARADPPRPLCHSTNRDRIGRAMGMRSMVVAGTVLGALQYPFLAEVHGVGIVLAELVAVSAIADTFYWTT